MLSFAATVATDSVYNAFLADDPSFCLMHGPTYMANPLACAAANASLDLFEQEPRLQQAQQMESELREALEPCRKLAGVVDVRCRGAVGVIQVAELKQLDRLRRRFVEHRSMAQAISRHDLLDTLAEYRVRAAGSSCLRPPSTWSMNGRSW